MKKYLAIGLIALAVMIFAWRDRAPAPATVEPAPVTLPIPIPEPLEPTKPPNPDPWKDAPAHWLCEEPNTLSGRQRAEEAWLARVLASPAQNDPMFGVEAWSMEAANCAAARERCVWMRCR
jgi:hypothetical protein